MPRSDTTRGKYSSPDGSAFWEYIVTIICSLLIFSIGAVPGWTSPTLGILLGPNTPIRLTQLEVSTLASSLAIGHAVAPIFVLIMADKLGRKKSILVSGLPAIIGWGLIAIAESSEVLCVARFMGGLSVGFVYCIPQMYLGEVASAKLRGRLGMVCGMMLNSGTLFISTIVPYLSIKTTALVNMGMITASVISVCLIPESPYYLAMIGKLEEAENALEKLRGKKDVAEELELVKNTISQRAGSNGNKKDRDESERGRKPNPWRDLFAVSGNRKALIINFLFSVALFLGGYSTILSYGEIIFGILDIGIPAHLCMIIISVPPIICNILTAFFIDKIGRRPLIFGSGIISSICLIITGVYLFLMEKTTLDVTPYSTIAFAALMVNVIILNFGLMPLQHVIQSETISTDVKGLAICVIGVGGGIAAITSMKLYMTVAETWEYGHCVPFFMFVIFTWTSTGIILKLLPETKGKTLFEIQKDLNA